MFGVPGCCVLTSWVYGVFSNVVLLLRLSFVCLVALVLYGLCCLYGGSLCAMVLLGLRVWFACYFCVVFMWCLLVSLRVLVLCINTAPCVLCFGNLVYLKFLLVVVRNVVVAAAVVVVVFVL